MLVAIVSVVCRWPHYSLCSRKLEERPKVQKPGRYWELNPDLVHEAGALLAIFEGIVKDFTADDWSCQNNVVSGHESALLL